MVSMFKTIGSLYLKECYLEKTDMKNLRYQDPTNFKDLECINLNPLVTEEIANLSFKVKQNEISIFRTNC